MYMSVLVPDYVMENSVNTTGNLNAYKIRDIYNNYYITGFVYQASCIWLV